jgi:hypothetical protein
MAWVVIAVLAVAAFAYFYGTGSINLPFSISGNQNQNTGLVDVNKKIEFSVTDKFSGTAPTTKPLYIYQGSPPVLVETLTTVAATGIVDSGKAYASGTQLYVKYWDTAGLDAKIWYSVLVPQMNSADAQSATYNIVDLDSFTAPASYTQTLLVSSVDASANYTTSTMSGNTAPIFVYQITNAGADNTGLMDSSIADPIYGDQWGTWLVCAITGAGYETVLPSGFDQTFQIGNTVYGVIHLSADMLTKWKVGNTYEYGYTGGETCTFSLDVTGYIVDTATMTVTAYAYCDPAYAQTHGGNFGNAKVVLSTDTVVLDGT